MKNIYFKNINYVSSRRIEFTCIEQDDDKFEEYFLYYEFSVNNKPSIDALALSFACMLGHNQYDNIYIDLDVSFDVSKTIKTFTNTNLKFKNINSTNYNQFFRDNEQNIILNFSGGFDSLAAMNLFDRGKVKLVSIDFGDKYTREFNFFQEFRPYILKTNIRSQKFFSKLESKSWQFMGIGTVLFFEMLNAKYYIFGTILEADLNFNCAAERYVLPFDGLGLECIQPTLGLTEVGTAKVVHHYSEQYIHKSLNSLSPIGTIKRLRKDLLSALYIKTNISVVKNFQFGRDYVFDFLLFYFLKKFGINYCSQYIKSIPNDLIELSKTMQLNLYEKLNPKSLITMPNNKICDQYLRRLFATGIEIYDSLDFKELSIIRNYLANTYNQNNNFNQLTDIASSVMVFDSKSNDTKYFKKFENIYLPPAENNFNYYSIKCFDENCMYYVILNNIKSSSTRITISLYDSYALKDIKVFDCDITKQNEYKFNFLIETNSNYLSVLIYAGEKGKTQHVPLSIEEVKIFKQHTF